MTMNRETMLSDLAQYGIKDLEALDDAGVKKMHDKWYPKMIPATPAEEKFIEEMNRDFRNASAFGKLMDGIFAPITPEQVEDAIDAVTLPQIAYGKEA
jgi:hypothetical protein